MADEPLSGRSKQSLVEDNKTATESNIPTAYGRVMAGLYTSSDPTLANTDFGFLRLTSDGKLMVDTELTLDGNVIVDNVAVFATDIADSSTNSFALVDAAGHQQIDILTMPGSLTGYAEDSVHNSGDIGLMPLAVRNDTLAALAGTDGDYAPVQVDANGAVWNSLGTQIAGEDLANDVMKTVQTPLATSTHAATGYQSAALEASAVVKASAGNIFSVSGYIDDTAASDEYYVQVIDNASVPGDGAVTLIAMTKLTHTSGVDTPFSMDFRPYGFAGANGLTLVISTTAFTKTIAGAVASFTAAYK
jgi:hypothetical protein